jgi:hypothetical protein
MSEEISWNRRPEVATTGPHVDYDQNVKIAENFCDRIKEKMPKGMRAYVVGSPELPKSLMYISWKPPKQCPVGNCATPIFLHDSTSNVNKRIEGIFNAYFKKAKEAEDKWPDQPILKGLEADKLWLKV